MPIAKTPFLAPRRFKLHLSCNLSLFCTIFSSFLFFRLFFSSFISFPIFSRLFLQFNRAAHTTWRKFTALFHRSWLWLRRLHATGQHRFGSQKQNINLSVIVSDLYSIYKARNCTRALIVVVSPPIVVGCSLLRRSYFGSRKIAYLLVYARIGRLERFISCIFFSPHNVPISKRPSTLFEPQTPTLAPRYMRFEIGLTASIISCQVVV